MTIGEFIKSYAPAYRGHTPGHKGSVFSEDITEILDIFPGDLITRAQDRAAELYGAEKLRFLVNGSSIGIKAAVLAARPKGIVTDAYRHRAVDEAAYLAGLEAVTVGGGYENGLPRLTEADDIYDAMKRSGADCAVVQYPDYYGRVADLKKIADAVHSLGGLLIADSAHGAHFALRPDLFPVSAVKVADACNMSAHKTLGSMTQTAFVAAGGRIAEGIDKALDALGTTSPNYMLLASLEKCVDEAESIKGRYDALVRFSREMHEKFVCADNADPTRLVFDCGQGEGRRTAYAFYRRGIAAEKYDDRYVVFILTPYDDERGLEALGNAAGELLERRKDR